ncbi:uncharacterized protein BDR25DRAFT_15007 [Lindgomyces ingoldianus]|uniref:Uncharacterized protein n=1 Tax=Lindgomyces ingoldianus TaxID=673940 RepID=A0ACB6QZR0_9PLEO|nr:uncharacterized protein BDR25DRAFT_15007 [Lindgomyces ingoldianus]KAF2472518.1 hypothetical protein BDR25DRAFT_15007 [Lindgomyces ingoldianus]
MPSPTQARGFFRSAARYLSEPHPFARNPVTVASHSVPYGVYGKRLLRSSAFYFPTFAVFFGWPIAGMYYLKKTGL